MPLTSFLIGCAVQQHDIMQDLQCTGTKAQNTVDTSSALTCESGKGKAQPLSKSLHFSPGNGVDACLSRPVEEDSLCRAVVKKILPALVKALAKEKITTWLLAVN
ncbi:hypothetical protein E2C01_066183 [Portunus trituberculatus]|uniref:Uncharacterized protein n=1 Tax=Portunus trituberculatus TaxID=210409 RepID=A0A5B7HKU1_PORTR|nr:hypothetical protein [Portunus trituberculatus]